MIQELHERGRQVLVGLEMYPVPEQQWLDRWHSDKALTEEGFLAESHWYKNWGYHWNYYRDIFLFARANGIRMFGVNLPRAAVQTVRMKGFDALSPEQQALLPEKVDIESAEHQRLFRAFFGSEDALHGSMPEPMFQAMFRAQCTWDAAMAWNAVQALKKHGGEKAIMVVLIGSGHVAYGLGRRAPGEAVVRREDGLGHPRPDRGGAGRDAASRRCRPPTPTSSGACPPSTDPLYPSVGISTPEAKSGERYKVIMVAKDSPAAAAGFKVGRRARVDRRDALHRQGDRQPPHVGEAVGRRGRLQGDARRPGADAHRPPAAAPPKAKAAPRGRGRAVRRRARPARRSRGRPSSVAVEGRPAEAPAPSPAGARAGTPSRWPSIRSGDG